MDCLAAVAAASGEMHHIERQVRALIQEHHRLMSTAEQLSPSAAEAKLSAASRIQQEIINKAYELREASVACRAGITDAPVHINTTSGVLPKPLAQMNIAQTSTAPDKPVLKGLSAAIDCGKTDTSSSFDFVSVMKPSNKVSLPVVAPNLVFHNSTATTPGLKFGTPPSAVFIIKVPPNQAGPLNIVTLQQNGITNGNNITAPVNGLQMNGVVVKTVAPCNNNNLTPKPIQIDDFRTTSAPSPLITHKIAVQATKNIETRPQRVAEEAAMPPPPPPAPSLPPLPPLQALEPSTEAEESAEKIIQGRKQQVWFLSHLSLCTPERFRELSERRTERRRRKTANPHFSSAAVEERRRQENERKKKKTSLHEGKSKAELKEKLEQQAEKLRTEKAALLRKHEQARQRLNEERLRAQMLVDQQRTVEQMLERLRKFMSIVAENRPPLCT